MKKSQFFCLPPSSIHLYLKSHAVIAFSIGQFQMKWIESKICWNKQFISTLTWKFNPEKPWENNSILITQRFSRQTMTRKNIATLCIWKLLALIRELKNIIHNCVTREYRLFRHQALCAQVGRFWWLLKFLYWVFNLRSDEKRVRVRKK